MNYLGNVIYNYISLCFYFVWNFGLIINININHFDLYDPIIYHLNSVVFFSKWLKFLPSANKQPHICSYFIFQVLGTDELNSYLNKYHLELDPQLERLVGRYGFLNYTAFVFNSQLDKYSLMETRKPVICLLILICIQA